MFPFTRFTLFFKQRVRIGTHVSDTDTHTTRIDEVFNLKTIY